MASHENALIARFGSDKAKKATVDVLSLATMQRSKVTEISHHTNVLLVYEWMKVVCFSFKLVD